MNKGLELRPLTRELNFRNDLCKVLSILDIRVSLSTLGKSFPHTSRVGASGWDMHGGGP